MDFFTAIILWAVFFGLSLLLTPKPKVTNARPAGLGDFTFPTATEGRPVPLVWGTCKIAGPNVIWYGDLKPKPITKKIKAGLFSTVKQITGYRYYVGIQFAICRGVVDSLKRIWINEKEVFNGTLGGEAAVLLDDPKLFGGDQQGSGGIKGNLRFYVGNNTQAPNSYINNSPPPFLWADDFTIDHKGLIVAGNRPFDIFMNSDQDVYYRVTNIGNVTSWGPGTTLDHAIMGTWRGAGSIHVHSNFSGGATGDLNKYVALLVNPGPTRPRINNNVKLSMTFKAKSAGSTDFGSKAIWMGCKVKDFGDMASTNGVFCVVQSQVQLDIYFESGSSGGPVLLASYTAPSDFPDMVNDLHGVEMRVDGATVTTKLDGNTLGVVTHSGILDIPTTHGGFCIGVNGNINQDFFTVNDWDFVGIYSLTIDNTTRNLVSDYPAYRGTSMAVWEGGYLGNSTSIQPWGFEVMRCPNGLALTGNKHIVNDSDANPMNVIYEMLTDPDWGLGFSDSDIDLTNFVECAETLYTEGNGFSMLIDTQLQASDFLNEVSRQIDGSVYLDRASGKFKCKLVRDDYDIDDVPVLDESNILKTEDFTRGSWHNTSNNIRVAFTDRLDGYKETYALAQDMANIALQGNTLVNVEEKYPGVKSRLLASQLAWRGLRLAAYPLAKVKFTTDRTTWNLNPGDAFAWTDAGMGFTKLPMRVTRMDLGKLEDGKIVIDAIQDVFQFEPDPSMAIVPDTSWVDPLTAPRDTDPDERLVFESPKALDDRADENPGSPDRIFVAARSPGDRSTGFEIWVKNGTLYEFASEATDFVLAATLNSNMSISNVPGTQDITISGTPDSAANIIAALSTRSPLLVGANLYNIAYVNGEFIGFLSAEQSGSDIILHNTYRGLMDSVPSAHLSGDRMWFISIAGNVTSDSYGPTSTESVKLLPTGVYGTLDIGLASHDDVTLNNRYIRPYAPTNLFVNGVAWDDSVSLDDDTTGGGGSPAVTLIDEPFTYSNGALATATSSVWTEGTYYGSIYNDSGLFINSNRVILPAYGNDGTSLPLGTEAWANHPDTASLDVTAPYEVSTDITLTTIDPDEYKADTVTLHTDTPAPYSVGNAYDIDGSWTTHAKITVDSRSVAGGGNWHITSYHLSSVGRTAVKPINPVHIANDIPNFTGTTFDVTYLTATPADGVLYSGTCGLVVEYDDTYPDVGLSVKVGYFPAAMSVTVGTIGVDDTSVSYGPGFVLYVNYKNNYYAAADVSAAVFSGTPFNLKVVVDDARFASIQIDGVEFANALLDAADVAFSNMGLYFNTSTVGDFNSRGIPDIVADNFLLIQSATTLPVAIDAAGLKFDFTRRDWRNTNEVLALDEANLPADFPTANTTEYRVKLFTDPAGADTLFYTGPWNVGGNSISVRRTDILRTLHGVPTDVRVEITARHTVDSVVWESFYNLRWDFSTASALLSGTFNWDTLDTSVESTAFTATSTGTYTLDIGTALATGNVQVKINAGAYSTVIAATTLTGTFAVTSGDVIKIKHTEPGGTGNSTGCFLRKETNALVAYAVLLY